jgi:enoyl-[acyl-carrier-protein] reductase (NADH)
MSPRRVCSKRCFDRITQEWGQIDIVVHSLAYAPKEDLQGLLIDCSAEGFKQAMDISCHSFVRMARLAAPLMKNGGSMFAMSYHGANKVVPNYNVMGPVKAALEAGVSLSRLRARQQGHPRARDLAWAAQDARGVLAQRLRSAPDRGRTARADRRTGRHHGRRLSPAHSSPRPTHAGCPVQRSMSTVA